LLSRKSNGISKKVILFQAMTKESKQVDCKGKSVNKIVKNKNKNIVKKLYIWGWLSYLYNISVLHKHQNVILYTILIN